jgi:hypothetical protein
MKTLTIDLVNEASELAVIEILNQTLETATIALMAANPYLFCEPPPWWRKPPRSSIIAQHIVELARQLSDALAHYGRAVDAELASRRDDGLADDEIPF